MIIPNGKIRIGNFDYTVEFTGEPIIFGNQICMGVCDAENQLIQIDDKMTEQNKERVVYHEVFHALCEFLNLYFEEDNEHVIDSLARGIMQLKKDNPLLFVSEETIEEFLDIYDEKNDVCNDHCECCGECFNDEEIESDNNACDCGNCEK